MNGELDLMNAATAVQKELTSIPSLTPSENTDTLEQATQVLENLKKITLVIAGAAAQKLMMKLKDEQEILMNVADMLIQIYMLESVIVKTNRIKDTLGEEASAAHNDICQLFMLEAVKVIKNSAEEALWSFSEGDELKMMQMALKRFTKTEAFNVKDVRRRVAQKLIEDGRYKF